GSDVCSCGLGLRRMAAMRDGFIGPRVVFRRWREDPEVFEAASPILRITPEAPDFFVLHGSNDSLVSVEQARLFVAKLREVSASSVCYAELPWAQYAFVLIYSVRVDTEVM